MLTGRELRAFRNNLLAWFRQHQRDLPWRRDQDPYRVWLSEIMLQQTRVAAVIPYYERFLGRFPTITALAEAPEQEVLRFWAGLGYYSRARNLQHAAQRIVGKYEGKFPNREVDLLALPGVGAYTSAAILSIAFNQRHAVLDGNVARVLARIFAVRGDLRESTRWQSLQKNADELLDANAPGDWNQAMMEVGATVCTPRAPQCLLCPVAKFCQARKLGIQDQLPEKRTKHVPVRVTLAAAVFVDKQGRTLLMPPPLPSSTKAAADHVPTLVSRMWHFPTIASGANPASELRGHLQTIFPKEKDGEWNLQVLDTVRHCVTYRNIAIYPFRLHVAKLPRFSGSRMVAIDNLASLPVSSLTRKIARAARDFPKS
jgi:A/G-specific adenine glycosylase